MESRYKAASDYSRCTGPHCRTGAFSGWAFKYRNHVPSTRTVSQKAKLVHLGISPDLWPLMDKVFALADALSVPMLIYSLNGASIVASYEGRGPVTLWLLCCSQTAHIFFTVVSDSLLCFASSFPLDISFKTHGNTCDRASLQRVKRTQLKCADVRKTRATYAPYKLLASRWKEAKNEEKV